MPRQAQNVDWLAGTRMSGSCLVGISKEFVITYWVRPQLGLESSDNFSPQICECCHRLVYESLSTKIAGEKFLREILRSKLLFDG